MADNQEELASLYVKVKADVAELERELVNIKRKIDKDSKENQTKLNFKAKFDTAIAKLRLSELQTLRVRLQKEFDKKVQMNVDAASLDRTRQKIQAVDQQLAGLKGSGSEVPGIFAKIGAAIGGAFAVQKIVRFGFEAVSLAAKAEGVERAFNNLNQPGLLENLRKATRNTVSDLELMQVTMRAANFKIPLSELATYLEFAQKRATMTGQEVDYLVNSIIDGIGRKSALVLDNLGISATELQDEFKKTGDFGKAAANIISREMKGMGDVIETTADKMAQLNAEVENQKVQIGKDLQPIWLGTLKTLGWIIGAVNSMGQAFKDTVAPTVRYTEALNDLLIKQKQYGNILMTTYGNQKKLSALIMTTYNYKPDTTYADDILKNYYEEKNQIDAIKSKLKDKTLSLEAQNVLQKELNSLLDKNNEKLSDDAKYIKDTLGSLDEYRKKIKLLQDELSKLGAGDTEKKLIIQAQIVDLNDQLDKAELEIIQKVNGINPKVKIDLEVSKSEKEGPAKDLKGDAIAKFYESAKTKGEDYFKWRVGQIQKEADELAKYDPVLAKQQEIDQIKALETEYFDWRMNQWTQQAGVMGDVFKSGLDGISAGYDTFWQSLANADMSGAERTKAIWEAIKSSALSTFGEILKGYIQNAIQQSVVGDAFRATEIAKGYAIGGALAAAYTPAATLASIMSFGGASIEGLAALQMALGSSQALAAVPKFAQGGIVPAGYPNDTFPALLTSGEVITPAGKAADSEKLFKVLSRKLDTLNKNLISKDFSPMIFNKMSLNGRTITKEVVSEIKRMQKEGRKF